MASRSRTARRVRRRQRRMAERILEDEGLRDGLSDDQARRLLDWGLEQVKRSAANTVDLAEEEADAELSREVARIRRQMRAVNRLVTRSASRQPEDSEEMRTLMRELESGHRRPEEKSEASAGARKVMGEIESLGVEETFDRLMARLAETDKGE